MKVSRNATNSHSNFATESMIRIRISALSATQMRTITYSIYQRKAAALDVFLESEIDTMAVQYSLLSAIRVPCVDSRSF